MRKNPYLVQVVNSLFFLLLNIRFLDETPSKIFSTSEGADLKIQDIIAKALYSSKALFGINLVF